MHSHIINNKSYTKQFRQAALVFPIAGANIIFIEKTQFLLFELE